jgi:hypothetical protein
MKKVLLLFMLASMLQGLAKSVPPAKTLPDQEPLKYKISVDVMVVPLFAVDEQGKPVFDLKKGDLELYLNGRPCAVQLLNRRKFSGQTLETRKRTVSQEERFIFVIIDTLFTSRNGFRRSKQITLNLINQAFPQDRFVIFENNPVKGLTLITGPTRPGEKLTNRIKKLKRPISRWPTQLFESRNLSNNIDFSIVTDFRLETEKLRQLWENELAMEREAYKHRLKFFSRSLSYFKYILNTINKPKIVFLLSEGTSTGVFKNPAASLVPDDFATNPNTRFSESGFESVILNAEKTVLQQNEIYSPFLFRYLMDIAQAVNYGGSVFYTVNPGRLNDINDENKMGETSLRYLADESGGKFFTGSDPGEIVKSIQKSTAAYYELILPLSAGMDERMEVNVKCLRQGVRVHTLNHLQRTRPYRQLEPMEKKIFALDILNGGSWSRMLARVMKVDYRKRKAESRQEDYIVWVPIPNQMRNRELDMFLIRINPQSQDTGIDLIRKKVKGQAIVTIRSRKHHKQFLVFIEPQQDYCIYTGAL